MSIMKAFFMVTLFLLHLAHRVAASPSPFSPNSGLPSQSPGAHSPAQDDTHALQGRLIAILPKHTGYVFDAAFAPDCQSVATSENNFGKQFRFWNATTGAHLFTVQSQRGAAGAIDITPDGLRVAYGVEIWDIARRRLLHVLPITAEVYTVSFTPDGRSLAVGDHTGRISLWDVNTGKLATGPSVGHSKAVYSLAFSADGRWMVSRSHDRHIYVYDRRTYQRQLTLQTEDDSFAHKVDISADGHRIAYCDGGHIKVCSATTGTQYLAWNGEDGACQGKPHSIAYSPNGRCISSGHIGGAVCVWHAGSGRLLAALNGTQTRIWAVEFCPTGRRLVSAGGWDKTAELWSIDCDDEGPMEDDGAATAASPSNDPPGTGPRCSTQQKLPSTTLPVSLFCPTGPAAVTAKQSAETCHTSPSFVPLHLACGGRTVRCAKSRLFWPVFLDTASVYQPLLLFG